MTQPRVKIITHRAKTRDGYEVEFRGGRRFSMKADTDVELDDAVKRAGLWKKAGEYPYFTIYKDGEEVGGGGGSNSGAMDSKGPRVRVYTRFFQRSCASFTHALGITCQGFASLPAVKSP